MRILSKAIRVLGAVVALLVLAVVCIILVVDPLPLRFSDGDNFVLSVKAPRQIDRKLAGSIERGLSCKVRLESYASGNFGRPVITIFDWLKQQTGALREPDYHIYGTKPNSAWAIKIDRATNKFCWLTAKQTEAGMTDAFCGPDIVREDEKRIQALQQDKYGTLVAVVFNKATYTATIASLDWWMPDGGAATIDYLDCFWP